LVLLPPPEHPASAVTVSKAATTAFTSSLV
jgi:hypothetical protein